MNVKPPPNKINVFRANKKKKPNAKRRKPNSNFDSDSESESESDESGFSGIAMPNIGSYFQRTYDTLSDFLPVFPSFFGSGGEEDEDEEDDDDDDASKIRIPKFKHSLNSKHTNKEESQEKNHIRWFDKYFFGSDDADETTPPPMPMPKIKVTTESGFFSWLSGSGEITTVKPVVEEAQTEKNGKIFQIDVLIRFH